MASEDHNVSPYGSSQHRDDGLNRKKLNRWENLLTGSNAP